MELYLHDSQKRLIVVYYHHKRPKNTILPQYCYGTNNTAGEKL